MQVAHTSLFRRSYRSLQEGERRRIDKCLRLFMVKPHGPYTAGLRPHKLGGQTGTPSKAGEKPPPIWEMHASDNLLVTFQFGADEVVFRNCGHHADVIRCP